MIKGIKNAKAIIGDTLVEDCILTFNNKILDIKTGKCCEDDYLDARGLIVSPGFIDIHIHGINGVDTMDGGDALDIMSEKLVEFGVTGFLATTITSVKEDTDRALKSIREKKKAQSIPSNLLGARLIGCHLEGPFINKEYKGAHKEEFVIEPDMDYIKEYLDEISLITLAPEKDVEFRFTNSIKEKSDIKLSIGHSGATYQEATAAIKEGFVSITHFFNAMRKFNHRESGIIGAGLSSDVFIELIADNKHVSVDIYDWLIRAKGHEKIILVSDSVRACCMKNGSYSLGDLQVQLEGDAVRLEDGTLAGSVLTLNKALDNVYKNSSVSLPDLIDMVTRNPATLLGLENYGEVKVGNFADLVCFTEDFEIVFTIIGGEVVYKR